MQACRALRGEGYRVVLVNSNPATIMTDPEWADATYLEPLDAPTLAEIIARERPDAFLPTLGGQTALNLAVELSESGVLAEHEVELIGANLDAIRTAEDRLLFRTAMEAAGLPVPPSVVVTSLDDLDLCPVPAVVRPAFTLGGGGGGLARTPEELRERVARGLDASPIGQVLVERSLEGWQEFELEVVADTAGNCVVICSIENLDPIGVHTGDSWTVAPQQTLPDGELQRLRDAAFACARAVGVATGGANVQFAYEPETRELALIEMNPRVSRSSALASKATGFPIAKLAALLAVGYTLDELPNDITGVSSAAFEPALDYVAVKAPRFDFDRFPDADRTLGTEMRAVGEALGIGRTFPEALLKALEGIESGDALPEIPGLHPYFAAELESIRAAERELAASGDVPAAKRFGLPDARIAGILGTSEADVRTRRSPPGRLAVDSCAGEFEAQTPYYYLSHEEGDGNGTKRGSIVVLGSGTNRIGQGIEFDYCCVRAAQAFRRLGHEVVLVNSNPETVSTDYDTCDRLYLEPVTLERVLDVVELERPLGVVVSLGGQTPLGLAAALEEAGVPLLGDPLPAIAVAEDRARFAALLDSLGVRAPAWGHAETTGGARSIADEIGYPVLVRPSYVLGGSRMLVARKPAELVVDGPALDRSLPGGRDRARRRHPLRRPVRLGGIGAGARRARGRPLGRLGLRRAGAVGHRPARERDPRARDHARPRARRPWPAQSPARVARPRALRARGEPAGLAHGSRSWRRRRASRSSTTPAGCCSARRSRELGAPGAGRARTRVGQGGDLPGRAPRRRRRPGDRDALDRRGDGERTDAGRRLPTRPPGRRPREAAHGRPGASAGSGRARDNCQPMERQGVVRVREEVQVELPWHRYTATWQPSPDVSADGPGWNEIDEAIEWARRRAPIVHVRREHALSETHDADASDVPLHPGYGGVVYVDEEHPQFVPTGRFSAVWGSATGEWLAEAEDLFEDVEEAIDWGRERAPVVLVAELPVSLSSVPTYEIRSAGDDDPPGGALERLRPRAGQDTMEWSFATQETVRETEPDAFSRELEEALRRDDVVGEPVCRVLPAQPGFSPPPAFDAAAAGADPGMAEPAIRGWVEVSFRVSAPTRKRAFELASAALYRARDTGEETVYNFVEDFTLHAATETA